MANVYVRYVTWVPGTPGSRKNRPRGGAAADIVAPPLPPTTGLLPGETFQCPLAPRSMTWYDGRALLQSGDFAFWSVTGGADGAIVTIQNVPFPTKVGNTDIRATAWYIKGGGGGGGSGFRIDAFDVNLGDFVNDDFVNLTPNSLTTGANNDGWVPTTSLAHIKAYLSINAGSFVDWKVVVGTALVNREDMDAAAGANAIAFAYYQPNVLPRPVDPREVYLPLEINMDRYLDIKKLLREANRLMNELYTPRPFWPPFSPMGSVIKNGQKAGAAGGAVAGGVIGMATAFITTKTGAEAGAAVGGLAGPVGLLIGGAAGAVIGGVIGFGIGRFFK